MKYSQQIIVKRWLPILKEYERTKAKVNPRQFKFIKDLCQVHHITRKELTRLLIANGEKETNQMNPFYQRNEAPVLVREEPLKR